MSLGRWFLGHNWNVVAVTRTAQPAADTLPGADWLVWDPFSANEEAPEEITRPFDAAIWAQGQNFNDSIETFDATTHEDSTSLRYSSFLRDVLVELLRNVRRKQEHVPRGSVRGVGDVAMLDDSHAL